MPGQFGGGVPRIPDSFDETSLSSELRLRVAGLPAGGSSLTKPVSSSVIWIDGGDEVLVHLDSLAARLRKGLLLVSVDLETDQTGRSPLVVVFAMTSDPHDPAGLVATTDEYPRGLGTLAARWGRTLQSALWASLLSIAQDHAIERFAAPRTIVVNSGSLHLSAGPPLNVNGGQSGGGNGGHNGGDDDDDDDHDRDDDRDDDHDDDRGASR